MWFLGITDQCVNYSWFSFFCFLYWDIWGNRDWKKTLYLILYCISKVVKIPRMSHTMTRGSTLMDKHFSRLVEVYPFLYHMRMHCQNSLFLQKDHWITLWLSKADISRKWFYSTLVTCQFVWKLWIEIKAVILQYSMHTKAKKTVYARIKWY